MEPAPQRQAAAGMAEESNSGDHADCIARQIIEWQESGSVAAFEALVGNVVARLEKIIIATLRQHGIRDATVADDALSLVLDHLRRLPGGGNGERHVARFVVRTGGPPCGPDGDPGIPYLEHLARSRAIDAARQRQRHRYLVFSQLDSQGAGPFEETIMGADPGGLALAGLCDLVSEAARQLEPRQQLLIELLLAGKSQAMIAHVLEVNEGTVSRLRLKAIGSLRQILEAAAGDAAG